MRGKSILTVAVLTLTALVARPALAESCCKVAISLTPIQQATQSDVVVVGQVTELEPEMVMVEPYPGGGKVAHMVATIRVRESLLGAKGLTHVRVAFVPTIRQNDFEEFGVQVQRKTRNWRGESSLLQGQDGCFFLQRHANSDLLVQVRQGYPLELGSIEYDNELKAIKNVLRAFDKPLEALKSKDAGQRQLAACALVQHYRQPRNGSAVVNEAIPAEESKLIINALAEMKWGELPFDPNGTFSLQNVFWQLQLTEKDGWRQPQQKENEDYNAVMQEAVAKWLKSNAESYRIQRMTASKAN